MSTQPEPLLVDADEGKRLTKLSNGTWYRLQAEGLLRPIRFGRATRYRLDDLRRLIDDLSAPPASGSHSAPSGDATPPPTAD